MRINRWTVSAAALAVMTTGIAVAQLAPERSLAGVPVGTKGNAVLGRFGNPTIVSPGLGATNNNAMNGAAPGGPPTGGPPGGPPPGAFGGRPNGSPPPGAFGPGGGGPGPLPPAGSDSSTGIGDEQTDNTGLTTWTYKKFKGGPTLEFRLDEDGRVVEMVATGLKPSPLARTSRGVTLGDVYGKVMRVYGFPEETSQQGNFLTAKYSKGTHVAFQFYKLRVVRIDVAKPKRVTTGPIL